MGFPCGSAGKESACSVGDLGLIPGLGRCPGEGKGYPLRYSGLENSMDCRVHGVAKSRTQLSNFHFQCIPCHIWDTHSTVTHLGLPWWLRQLRTCLKYGRPGFDPWVGKSQPEATYSTILAWRIPMVREAWQATVRGVAKSQT